MVTPTAVSYSAPSDSPVVGGRFRGGAISGAVLAGDAVAAGAFSVVSNPVGPVTLAADGIWTWFTDPRAVERNGAVYFMAVNSAGTAFIYKYVISTRVTTSFQLSTTGLEVDDHDNGSLIFKPDGRIVAFYGSHNDSVFRYRVSTNPEDISAWGTELQRGSGQGSYSYPNPYQFSQDTSKFYFFNRRWLAGDGVTRNLSYRTTTAIADGSDPWSAYVDVLQNTGQRPYWHLASDGVKRLHVFNTTAHPAESSVNSLYHFYMELDGGNVPRFFKSDGTSISVTLPMGLSDITQIYDGTTVKCWVSDAAIDSSGRPRVLWMRYPGNDGSAIEYWHSAWSGSAWISTKVTDDGAGLYAPEVFYHGGLCFDSIDPSHIYLSAPISGVRQIQEWSTPNVNGTSWSKVRDITTSGAAGNPFKLRPYSPRNRSVGPPVLWVEGAYTSYINYNTAVKASY